MIDMPALASMPVCVVTFKECWRDADGLWLTDGGFPGQMAALASVFGPMTIVICEIPPRDGGSPLPATARVVPLARPTGHDWRRKLSFLTRVPGYSRTIRREIGGADVVHVPLPGDVPLLGMAIAIAERKRIFARYCSSWETNTQTTVWNRLTKAWMRALATGKHVMLATGAAADFPADGVRAVFATSITDSEVKRVQPDLVRLPGSVLRLSFAGRLSREKGIRYLIEAIASLRAQADAPRIELEIMGDGPSRAELEALVRRIDATGVRFLGQLNRGALLDRLQQSDVCVLPSLSESYCKARLDAMLCGTPVITTPVGSGRAITGPNGERGLLVPVGRADAIADAVRRAAAWDDWPARRARCRRFAEQHTLERWAEEIAGRCRDRWDTDDVREIA